MARGAGHPRRRHTPAMLTGDSQVTASALAALAASRPRTPTGCCGSASPAADRRALTPQPTSTPPSSTHALNGSWTGRSIAPSQCSSRRCDDRLNPPAIVGEGIAIPRTSTMPGEPSRIMLENVVLCRPSSRRSSHLPWVVSSDGSRSCAETSSPTSSAKECVPGSASTVTGRGSADSACGQSALFRRPFAELAGVDGHGPFIRSAIRSRV